MKQFQRLLWIHLGIMAAYYVLLGFLTGSFTGEHLGVVVLGIFFTPLLFAHLTTVFIFSLVANSRGDTRKSKANLVIFAILLVVGFSVCSIPMME